MENKPRRVDETARLLLYLIPNTERAFIEDIRTFLGGLYIQPPESLVSRYCWEPLQYIMEKYIVVTENTVLEKWQKEVINLYVDKKMV